MDYSTQGVVVVHVPVIGIEVGIVVKGPKPASPRNL